MTTPGYPDYARIPRAGNQQLFFTNANVTNGQTLFRGYVGSWPYTLIFMTLGASADFLRVRMLYYTDATFTNQSGFRYLIRTGANFSCVTYGNMSDWLIVTTDTKSGNPFPVLSMGIYATLGFSEQMFLDSNDVPLLVSAPSVPANSTTTLNIQHVHPGNAKLIVSTALANWTVALAYYDWTGGAFVTLIQVQPHGGGGEFVIDYPQIEAPMQVKLVNMTAAAAVMQVFLLQAA